jgi:ATP-dependent protease ClpP protease subunit
LHINSYGGYIFHGLSAMDNMLLCKSAIITVVDGICASAATFLSLVGKHRQMTKNSFMLIHQLSSCAWGTYSNIIDAKENLDLLMKTINNIYEKYTNIPSKKLNEILKHDLYFDAKKCLAYKMVDEII